MRSTKCWDLFSGQCRELCVARLSGFSELERLPGVGGFLRGVVVLALVFAACSPQCCSGRGRRPGRGKNTELMILACHRDLFSVLVCWFCRRPGRGYKYGALSGWFARQRQPSS